MGFHRQEYWSGLPFPSLGDLPDPGNEPTAGGRATFIIIPQFPLSIKSCGITRGKEQRKVTFTHTYHVPGFPGGSVVKNLPANAGDTGGIPVLGRSPREGNGNPLQ